MEADRRFKSANSLMKLLDATWTSLFGNKQGISNVEFRKLFQSKGQEYLSTALKITTGNLAKRADAIFGYADSNFSTDGESGKGTASFDELLNVLCLDKKQMYYCRFVVYR
jgi:hypothetical protein